MQPVFVIVLLVDPASGQRFTVSTDVQVDIVSAETLAGREDDTGGLPLQPDPASGLFFADEPTFQVSHKHHFRIRLLKLNFSRAAGKLLDYHEVTRETLPVYCPSRLPYWDSGWVNSYRFNKYFGPGTVKIPSAPDRPIPLEVPVRELYIIGHRGAPHRFPENTMASFREALDLGANGLELDLCLTKDRNVAVFHDPEPVKYPGRIDRTMFEGLPFGLVSPIFDITGREVGLRETVNGTQVDLPPRALASEDEFDILNLTYDQVRRYYHYDPADGIDHPVPGLDEFLTFASAESRRLRFVFLDTKNPAGMGKRAFGNALGTALAEALRKHTNLPDTVVVCNEDPAVLQRLKRVMRREGEMRCRFAYDASGGIHEYIGIYRWKFRWYPRLLRTILRILLPFRYNPLRVARRMKNSVVSVGTLLRPAHRNEIVAAVRDRDYYTRSTVDIVVHWTLNSDAQFAESLNAGVNGIVTDKPDQLAAYLKSRRMRVQCP
jgi:glycerophosphoryl diester phosphodiesterase